MKLFEYWLNIMLKFSHSTYSKIQVQPSLDFRTWICSFLNIKTHHVYTNDFFVYITHYVSSDITILKQPRHVTACLDINKLTKENDEPHHIKL